MGHADPQAERAALARALARELGRRAFHGERGLAPPGPLESLPHRGSDAGDARTAPGAPPGTEQAVETSLATGPPESGRPARGPAESGREPGAMPPMPQGELTSADVDDRRAADAAASAYHFDKQLRQKPARFIRSIFWTSFRLSRCANKRRNTAASIFLSLIPAQSLVSLENQIRSWGAVRQSVRLAPGSAIARRSFQRVAAMPLPELRADDGCAAQH